MFDIRWIKENQELFDHGLKMRGLEAMSHTLLAIDEKRRSIMKEAEQLQAQRNASAKEIGKRKAVGEDVQELIDSIAEAKQQQAQLDQQVADYTKQLSDALVGLPNIPLDDVPFGEDEDANVEVKREGTIPSFSFTPKEHHDLGEALGQMDFETAAKLSGSRFVILRKDLARLERAIASFMLDVQTQQNHFEELQTPVLVREQALYGTGQFPKFMEDVYATTQDGFYLIPTAEVTLTNTVAGKLLDKDALPMRFTGLTNCFRAEAGSAGRDIKGMIRQHQFNKVEMVSICTPEQGLSELDYLVQSAETILQQLELPYRILLLCSQDMGAGAQKTYDLEVWLPGQNQYREISSCSFCGNYQALRMNTRFREKDQKKSTFVCTLNGSGLAVGRTLIAVMENYQQEDGSIAIPKILQPYMHGQERIEAK